MYSYKGIGRIPKGLRTVANPNQRILLDQLPRLLQGYGKTYPKGNAAFSAAVIVVCDLDNKSQPDFLQELNDVLSGCNPQPEARFCLAIEEGEAWLLGDSAAIKRAYPRAKEALLDAYQNDSICGTWEYLANVIYPGGSQALQGKEYGAKGALKSEWAEKIAPHMDVTQNASPSFNHFLTTLLSLTT